MLPPGGAQLHHEAHIAPPKIHEPRNGERAVVFAGRTPACTFLKSSSWRMSCVASARRSGGEDKPRLPAKGGGGATKDNRLVRQSKKGAEQRTWPRPLSPAFFSLLSFPFSCPSRVSSLPCPCLVLPCLALPCLVFPCLAWPGLALPCLALPCLTLALALALALPGFCRALPCLAFACLAACPGLPCPTLPCLVLPCLALPCLALPCRPFLSFPFLSLTLPCLALYFLNGSARRGA